MFRVIIFSASFGSGHKSASEAIHQCFQRFYRDTVSAEVVDFFEYFTPRLNKLTRFFYEKSLEVSPSIYGTLFDITNRHPDSPLVRELNKVGLKDTSKFLVQYKPNIVISTYPVAGGVTAEIKDDSGVFAATVITDFGVHAQWIHPKTDLYLVANDKVRDFLIGKGIAPEQVEVTGIPIASKFAENIDKKSIRQKLKLQNEFTALVMGSAYGQAEIKKLCRELKELSVQAVVICGNNKKLYEDLTKIQKESKNLNLYGFVDNMEEFMAASDVYVGKAGGLTIAEAFAKGLPLIIFNPIPGQEILNVEFIIDEGVGFMCQSIEEVVAEIKLLSANEEIRHQMRRKAKYLGKPEAATLICRKVLAIAEARRNER